MNNVIVRTAYRGGGGGTKAIVCYIILQELTGGGGGLKCTTDCAYSFMYFGFSQGKIC